MNNITTDFNTFTTSSSLNKTEDEVFTYEKLLEIQESINVKVEKQTKVLFDKVFTHANYDQGDNVIISKALGESLDQYCCYNKERIVTEKHINGILEFNQYRVESKQSKPVAIQVTYDSILMTQNTVCLCPNP